MRSWKQIHTVAIWTFIFHKISGFERVILKVNFNPIYRQKLSILLSENAALFYSFFFYFLQNLSNPVLFTHCCCYSKELTCLNCDFCIKLQFPDQTSDELDLLVWNLSSKSPTHSLIFMKCEFPNNYSVTCKKENIP